VIEQVATTDDAHRSAPAQTGTLVTVRGLRKQYGNLMLFENISFQVKQREMLAIVGQSGAGKSTLLHILGALDGASGGDVYFGLTLLRSLTPVEAADFRNREIGYVWQFHYLLPEFTAAENVALPLLARGESKREALRQAAHWLDEVGLADRLKHRAGELSGGEQQRVSIARALITTPKLLLADEPTGDLDDQTADALFALIERLHASYGLTSILVTHNLALARRCNRVLRLSHGHTEEVSPLAV
jgi:lipoprotein-releasing system ATP-binding protein